MFGSDQLTDYLNIAFHNDSVVFLMTIGVRCWIEDLVYLTHSKGMSAKMCGCDACEIWAMIKKSNVFFIRNVY